MSNPSTAQLAYIASHRRNTFFIRFARIFFFLLFLVTWELASYLGWIDSFIFSSPSQVVL